MVSLTPLLLLLALAACDSSESGTGSQMNPAAPFLRSPFNGSYPVTNVFDHSTAVIWSDDSYREIAFWGDVVPGVAGHRGYDWLMPVGTPLIAVAGGVVHRSGPSAEEFCPPLGRSVVNVRVILRHERPGGEHFLSIYSHMSRADVAEGERVEAGALLGLSGNTGCSTDPHLHFPVPVQRQTAGPYGSGLTGRDQSANMWISTPFGWTGSKPDPWGQSPSGHRSWYLWMPEEAPQLVFR